MLDKINENLAFNAQCTMHNEGGGLRPLIIKAAAKGFGGDRKAPEIRA